MTAYPVERLLALAVKARLVSALAADRVGHAVKPSGGGWASEPPLPDTQFVGYAVIYAGMTGPTDGPASGDSFDATQTWQVTSCGASADQANDVRDICRGALLGVVLAVTGRATSPVDLSDAQPVQRDDDVDPPVFFAVDRFTTRTTPA